jgi:methyltransferase
MFRSRAGEPQANFSQPRFVFRHMAPSVLVAVLALLIVLVFMGGEAVVSRANEQRLRRNGAVEPPDDIYTTMRWAYPAAFVVMAGEGALSGPAPGVTTAAGVALFAVAKALKYWAMVSLGRHWTFRVLVIPGAPLVTRGPYAAVRHPNYIAVIGELAGMALSVGARVSGPLVTLLFGLLVWKRIRVENRALRHLTCS